VSAFFYYVHSGQIDQINSISVCRIPNSIPYAHIKDLKFTFALSAEKTSNGISTSLGCVGHTRGGGGGRDSLIHNHQMTKTQLFDGRLRGGRTYLLYIEGDTSFVATRDMTIDEFAKKNNGNFFVVTISQ